MYQRVRQINNLTAALLKANIDSVRGGQNIVALAANAQHAFSAE